MPAAAGGPRGRGSCRGAAAARLWATATGGGGGGGGREGGKEVQGCVSCALGGCLTSRPEGCLQPSDSRLIYMWDTCTCTCT